MGLATNDRVQVVTRYEVNGQVNLMVLHYRVTNPDPTTSVEQDCLAIADWFSDAATLGRPMQRLLPMFSTNTLVRWVRAQRVGPTRSVFRQSDVGEDGSFAGTSTAQNLTVSLTKRTNTPGRKGIGRVQMGGVSTTVYDEGRVVSADYKTRFNLLEAALTGTVTAAAPLQIVQCLPASVGGPAYDVVDMLLQPEVRTMTRRTVGRGI